MVTANDKTKGHTSVNSKCMESNLAISKNDNVLTLTVNNTAIEAPITDYETVKLYKDEIIFDENNPEDNPPSSLQTYQGEQFVMCPPFGTSNAIANNSWMNDSDDAIDRFIYMEEWLRLYKDLSSIGMVYLTPTHSKLQDQVYISNGIWVPFNNNKYCLMPNFKVEGRKANKDLGIPGENAVNGPFMQMLGYNVVYMPESDENGEPMYFEGSADIKLINGYDEHGCVYVCGTGIRTSENAARWIENWLNEIDTDPNSHHKVISYPQQDEDCYHLDCVCEPIDADHTMLYVNELSADTLSEIEKYTTIIPVTDVDIAKAGVCNVLRAGNFIFMNSDIQMLEGTEYIEDYNIEKKKIEFMQKVCNQLGLELNIYCLSEAIKGGACLSCNVADIRGWAFLKNFEWTYKY